MAEADGMEATYTAELQKVNAKLDRIIVLLTGGVTAPTPAPPPPPGPPTPAPAPTPPTVPPAPTTPVQAVYWINKSPADLSGAEAVKIIEALNRQAEHLVEGWPTVPPVAHVLWGGDPAATPAGGWKMYWLPDADTAGALGYHDVDPHGDPYGRVFTRYSGRAWPALTPGGDGISISNISSHEAVEIQVDPGCASTAKAPGGDEWALESADPVESFSYTITTADGTAVSVSDFVTAAFFGEGSGPADPLGAVKPFTIAAGGYAIINGKQVFADSPSLRYLSQHGSPAGRTARRLAASGLDPT